MAPRTRVLFPVSAAVGLGIASGLYLWRRSSSARRDEHPGDGFSPGSGFDSGALPVWAKWGVNESELFRDLNHLPH